MSACSGIALRTDRNIFTYGHRHRSRNHARHTGHEDGSFGAEDAATPIIRLAVETMASSDPRTAARSHPARPLRWHST